MCYFPFSLNNKLPCFDEKILFLSGGFFSLKYIGTLLRVVSEFHKLT